MRPWERAACWGLLLLCLLKGCQLDRQVREVRQEVAAIPTLPPISREEEEAQP